MDLLTTTNRSLLQNKSSSLLSSNCLNGLGYLVTIFKQRHLSLRQSTFRLHRQYRALDKKFRHVDEIGKDLFRRSKQVGHRVLDLKDNIVAAREFVFLCISVVRRFCENLSRAKARNCCACVLWRCLSYLREMIFRAVAFSCCVPKMGTLDVRLATVHGPVTTVRNTQTLYSCCPLGL